MSGRENGDNMINIYENKTECTGCTACYSVCPVQAINMEQDEEGFYYPVINQGLCIDCCKCQRVCPEKSSRSDLEPISLYAVKSKDDAIRMRSSSGGSFTILAEWIEQHSGVIYGAAYDDQFQVKHYRAEKRSEWEKFRVSKYVQSNLGETFKQIKSDLIDERFVLFTGTPCQVNGLKAFLKGIDANRLITCDIICHGTSSPKVWGDYLEYIQKKYRVSVKSINFRDKHKFGWHNSNLSIWGAKGTLILSESQKDNMFFQLFYRHLILKPACYECAYSNFFRPGDITLGDYWGVDKYYPDFDDDKGTSLLMCNTERGKKLWEEIKNQVKYIHILKEECLQPNLQKPSKRPDNRDQFWKIYQKYGIKKIGQDMGLLPLSHIERICRKIGRVLRKIRTIIVS